MKVHSLFTSLQGEGRFQGYPSFFIRLYGCNLNCVYCDAEEAVSGGNYTEMSIDDVAGEVKKAGIRDVCITGGEPFCQREELKELINGLSANRITVETNGTFDISMDLTERNRVFFSVDWKTPASGNADFEMKNIEILKKNEGWIKFVVSDSDDLDFVEKKLKFLNGIEVFISPVFEKGTDFFKKVSYFVMNYENVRMQLQLHKILKID